MIAYAAVLENMASLSVRLDRESAALLERLAKRQRKAKSEIVRVALQALRSRERRRRPVRPFELVSNLIGSWDSGGQRLSERTGRRFAQTLKSPR
jgi:hypothetical protein